MAATRRCSSTVRCTVLQTRYDIDDPLLYFVPGHTHPPPCCIFGTASPYDGARPCSLTRTQSIQRVAIDTLLHQPVSSLVRRSRYGARASWMMSGEPYCLQRASRPRLCTRRTRRCRTRPRRTTLSTRSYCPSSRRCVGIRTKPEAGAACREPDHGLSAKGVQTLTVQRLIRCSRTAQNAHAQHALCVTAHITMGCSVYAAPDRHKAAVMASRVVQDTKRMCSTGGALSSTPAGSAGQPDQPSDHRRRVCRTTQLTL